MKYSKDVLCLACSRKPWGRCVAGKVWSGADQGSWARPVTLGEHSAIADKQRQYADGYRAVKLDIVRMFFTGKDQSCFQAENHIVATDTWQKVGRIRPGQLAHFADAPDTYGETVTAPKTGETTAS